MSMKKLASAAAVAALFALPLGVQAQQSPGTLMKDSAITAKIKAAQAADATVRATRINVETDNNGVVTLSGTARSQAEIDRAVELARGIEGVTSVNNRMTLTSTADTGSTGTTTTTTTTTPADATSGTMRAPRSDRG
jgi:hyperosmotically inducible protein